MAAYTLDQLKADVAAGTIDTVIARGVAGQTAKLVLVLSPEATMKGPTRNSHPASQRGLAEP